MFKANYKFLLYNYTNYICYKHWVYIINIINYLSLIFPFSNSSWLNHYPTATAEQIIPYCIVHRKHRGDGGQEGRLLEPQIPDSLTWCTWNVSVCYRCWILLLLELTVTHSRAFNKTQLAWCASGEQRSHVGWQGCSPSGGQISHGGWQGCPTSGGS